MTNTGPIAVVQDPIGGDAGDLDRRTDLAARLLLDRFHEHNDAEALAELFEIGHARLLAIARHVLGSMSLALDAEDLVSSFFVRLFRGDLAKRPPIRSFFAFARVVLRNEALTCRRSQVRAWKRMLECRKMMPPPADPACIVADREQLDVLGRAGICLLAAVSGSFHSLNDRDRRALLLREQEGCSYEEVAARMNIQPKRVGMMLFRARRRLQDRIVAVLEAGSSLKQLADLVYELATSCMKAVPEISQDCAFGRQPRSAEVVAADVVAWSKRYRRVVVPAELVRMARRDPSRNGALQAASRCLAVLQVLEGRSHRLRCVESIVCVQQRKCERGRDIMLTMLTERIPAGLSYCAHLNLSFSLIRMEQYEEGLAYAERATKIQPSSPNAYQNVTSAAMSLRRRDKVVWALRRLREVERIQPSARGYRWLKRWGREYAQQMSISQSELEGNR